MAKAKVPPSNISSDDIVPSVRFSEALIVWLRIALLSFGGPAGQIAVMHRLLVDEKKWLSEDRFLHALNFCMLLPGPEAQQLTIYAGWLTHRVIGGVTAGLLFVLPGAVAMMVLSWIYAAFGESGLVDGLFFTLKAAVLAIVFQAVVKIGSKALTNRLKVTISVMSFVALFAFSVPFPAIILCAGLLGYFAGKKGLKAFHTSPPPQDEIKEIPLSAHRLGPYLTTAFVILCLWLTPTLILFLFAGPDHVFTEIAFFFSKMAVVTFGGAYAVLSYVAQAAVTDFGWLQAGEMLDGLGLAETTPGPLIMVTQFVGYLGAYREPGSLSPAMAGLLGGMLTTWVTFTPCFLWIFLGAPYVEKIRQNRALTAALSAITAAVVGVIVNIAFWFLLHVLFGRVVDFSVGILTMSYPEITTFNGLAAIFCGLAFLAVFRFKIGLLPLIAVAALSGIVLHLTGLV
ncbi:chromate efflux transporter [Sneathiella aquimaris]|uniref:chromate efflux transporter n=1 Tax=Sneathiella aquimaris TaxID=2599305 RepID=UPI00146A3004|nr:chromate efflux transporter [Sneathiella aquimaris]